MTPCPPPSAALLAPLLAHGRLPHDVGEWAFFVVVAAIGAWVLWKAVRYSVHPGEEEPDHVKRSILDDEPRPPSASPPRPT